MTGPDPIVDVRPATPGDVAVVIEIWRSADAHPSVTDDEAALLHLLDRDPGALLIGEVDGVAVGTLMATFDGWRGHIHRLAVVPSQRRRGVATRLLQAGEERLTALGVRRVAAIVVDGAAAAMAFWQAAGYDAPDGRLRYVRNLTRRGR